MSSSSSDAPPQAKAGAAPGVVDGDEYSRYYSHPNAGGLAVGSGSIEEDVMVVEDGVAVKSVKHSSTSPLSFDEVNKELQPSDILAAQIAQADEERRMRVIRRRNPKNPILKGFQWLVPYGGIASSAFNIASSTIGGGIIGLPAAFQMSGIGMAIIYLVVVVVLAVYSFVLLAIVAEKTGIRNWELLARRVMGRGWDYFVVFVMWFLCFGGDVSYVISVKAVIQGFISHSPTASGYINTTAGYRLITSIVWLVVILPLCLPKEINSLRIVSTVAILFVVFFAVTVVVHSGQSIHQDGLRKDLVYFQSGNTAVNGLSMFLFAFIAQVNALEVHGEMANPSVQRVFLSALLGMAMCFLLYFFAGLFGYLEFGPAVKDSVLQMYDPIKTPIMAVSFVGMILKLCVGFALHLIPCRDCLYYVLGTEVNKVAWWKNCILCTLQATLALVAGLFIPRITTVFGLLGGFCGSFVGFIFPALFMMYAGNFTLRGVGWFHFFATYALLIVGVIACVFGTTAAIHGEVVSS